MRLAVVRESVGLYVDEEEEEEEEEEKEEKGTYLHV